MTSSVLHERPPLEELGLLCSTLFLDSYTLPSFEEVLMTFEDWLNETCDSLQLNFILNLLKQMCVSEAYFLKVSKLASLSNHFCFSNDLAPTAGLNFFQKLFHEDYSFDVKEISYFVDNVTQVILFNNVSAVKISETCKFFGMLANEFLNCELLHKHALHFDIF